MTKRIGIFAGSFDPVHSGHIEFALAAASKANLDKVYFLPEPTHRHKRSVSHLAHRLGMLKLAIASYSNLAVLDLPDRQFSVAKTLPRLNQKFPNDQLFLIVGSDLLEYIGEWPLIDRLLSRMGLIVGLRAGFKLNRASILIKQLPNISDQVFIIKSPAAAMSSAKIRKTFLTGQEPKGLDQKVTDYIKANWLYASPSNSSSAS